MHSNVVVVRIILLYSKVQNVKTSKLKCSHCVRYVILCKHSEQIITTRNKHRLIRTHDSPRSSKVLFRVTRALAVYYTPGGTCCTRAATSPKAESIRAAFLKLTPMYRCPRANTFIRRRARK